MSFKDFKVVEGIGKGSFASVYKVIRKSDNKVYALKRVKINKMSKKEIADALNEIRFLASIRHKNVVGFLEAFLETNETELCIVMEYCGCGDLAQKVDRYKRRRQHIDEAVIWRYFVQCLKALQNLHEKGICHRDLKAANTFLAEDGSVKIGDMNVSKRLQKGQLQLQTQIGTPYYMAPEIWNNKPYDSSADIWALGCLLYELASLKPPFTGESFPALRRNVLSGRYPPIPRKYTDLLHKTIAQMLSTNPRNRLSATAMLSSPDLRTKLQLDEIVTSFGHRILSEQTENLMETIKVPLGNNLRKLGTVLPKPCYPDVRPNSPSSWTVAEQVKQRSSLLRSTDNSAAHTRMPYMTKATGLSDDTPVGFIPCSIPRPPAPRLSLASIPESKNNYNNYNNPSRALYSHVPAINIPPKVNYVVQSRPALLNRYLVPQQPTGLPLPSQAHGLYDRERDRNNPLSGVGAAGPGRLIYRRIW